MYILIISAIFQDGEKEVTYLLVKCDSGFTLSLLIVRYDAVFYGTISGIFVLDLLKGLLFM